MTRNPRQDPREFALRAATLEDLPVLERLVGESARGLSRQDYREEQIEAALGTALGVDSQLIRDGTYFVVEAEGEVVGCGGWSWRGTLFGGDAQGGRRAEVLDPAHDAARIRAFFVRPDWARRGIGRALLERCEAEARARGFRSAELMATLPGERLYAALGYRGEERIDHRLSGGVTIEFVPMRRQLG
jgi:GNAT superfamily N-acetyltransferase